MSIVIAWADLRARLEGANLGVPIAWPNEDFTRPQDGDANVLPFIVAELSGGAGEPIELGGSTWQAEGQAMVHVLVPSGSGVDAANALVDQITAAFRGPPLEPVVYIRAGSDPGSPGTEDGMHWRTTVTADWHLQTYVPRS